MKNTANIMRMARSKTNNYAEGVLVAKKDFEIKHNDIDTKNLYVRAKASDYCIQGFTDTASSGSQSLPIPHLPRLLEDAILMAMVLLHPDPRRLGLPARMATPSR